MQIFRAYARSGDAAAPSPSVLAVTACERSHSLAAATSDGAVHVFRVEWQRKKETLIEYTGAAMVKTVEHDEGAVIDVQHAEAAAASLLVYATRHGRLHAWDLRAKHEAWTIALQVHSDIAIADSYWK